MSWEQFIYFALSAIACSVAASVMSLCGRRKIAVVSEIISICILGAFVCGLWLSLERPPLRTTGETRLWYSFFAAS